jgi:non-canonical (house-cleaning) NTP pyrophosphatase
MISISDRITAKTVEGILASSKEIEYFNGDGDGKPNTVAGALDNEAKKIYYSDIQISDITEGELTGTVKTKLQALRTEATTSKFVILATDTQGNRTGVTATIDSYGSMFQMWFVYQGRYCEVTATPDDTTWTAHWEEFEKVSNKVTSISSGSTNEQYASAKAVYTIVKDKEDKSNKVTSISSSRTDTQYPTAKATYNGLETKENISNKVNMISQDSTHNEYPSAKAVYDAIAADRAVVNISTSKNVVFVGVESSISLNAATSIEATNIRINRDSEQIATGSGMSLTYSDTITPQSPGGITYTAYFTVIGFNKSATKSVLAVYPIMYGSGDDYTDATTKASARSTVAGTYNITVGSNGEFVFFVVPRNMSINSAKMSGFDFPLQEPVNVDIDGVAYKYYKSANTYDADTLTIVIS